MLFNSPVFILIFLPLVLLGFDLVYRRAGRRAAVCWLFLSSLFFYAWANPPFVLLLIGSLAFNYLLLRLMGAAQPEQLSRRRVWMGLGVFANLALLGYFKYANFFLDNVNAVAGTTWHIEGLFLPIGISFFTFQQIAFLVDMSSGRIPTPRLIEYCFFVSFFPQLIAGPIVRHDELIPQAEKLEGRLTAANLSVGITVFAIGLAKKMVIADGMGALSSPIFNAAAHGIPLDLTISWFAVLAYSLQIYFDFSGYSDMAVGLGRMFGFQIPINFASPYKARSISDFWRRWHITLSRFLRDYLYIPLGGNRLGESRRLANLMTTMALGGIWHGAGWTFLIWGLLHGVYLVINNAWRKFADRKRGGRHLHPLVAWFLTSLCVIVAWVPFRAGDLTTTLNVWASMIGLNGVADSPLHYRIRDPALIGLIASWMIAWVAPNTSEWMRRANVGLPSRGYSATVIAPPRGLEGAWRTWRPDRGFAIVGGVLLALSALHFFSLSEFIYFQF